MQDEDPRSPQYRSKTSRKRVGNRQTSICVVPAWIPIHLLYAVEEIDFRGIMFQKFLIKFGLAPVSIVR